MWFTRVSIHNPVFATMMMVGLLVLGIFSYQRLAVDEFPNINFPVVVVSTEYPGAAPETVETDVSRPLEETLNTVAGINHIASQSYEGLSVVIAEFKLNIDPNIAAQDARDKIAAIRPSLRTGIKEPRVQRFNPKDAPIVSISVRSDTRSLRDLTTLTEQVIKKRFEKIRGVGAATIIGGVQREINIYLHPEALEALGIGVNQIINVVSAENQELPAGAIQSNQNETIVRVTGRIGEAADFSKLVIAHRAGTPIYLSQLAKVVDGQEEDETLALINGQRALSLELVKTQEANTIAIVDDAYQLIKELAHDLPKDIRLDVIYDASLPIRSSVANVQSTLIEGAILTIGIVFLFLASWRSTVITGLTLPISIIGTFTVMFIMGFSINLLTLMALSLCIGLLIDDAIVVRENIVRHMAMGKDHHTAALVGTEEIGLAVLATTLSIVAVFLPVGFMGGIIGKFFHQFGVTVAFAVLLSMFVSFTLDPMLSSVWHDPQAHGHSGNNRWSRFLQRFNAWQERLATQYQALLRWALAHRKSTLVIAALTFFASFLLLPFIGTEFVPPGDKGEVMVQFKTPPGSSLELTRRKAVQVEQAMRELPEMAYTYTTINTGHLRGKNTATISGTLKPRAQRKRLVVDIQPELHQRLARIAGIEIINIGQDSSVGNGKPIQISIQGRERAVLEQLSAQVITAIRTIPGVSDLENSLQAGQPTIAIDIKRQLAANLGLGVNDIGNTLRPLLTGDPISTWKAEDGESYNVRVRLNPDARSKITDLQRLSLLSKEGAKEMVKLTQVATFRDTLGPTQIHRKDLNPEILISANASGRPAGDIGKDIDRALAKINLPAGYHFSKGGANQDMAESISYAAQALLLAIIFIYLILASQFKSFLQPIAIMVSLPMALIGVFLALLLARSTLNIFSIIGFIMLMGLVTKNAILLIDFVNQARTEGLARYEAIIEAGKIRLRPILMTTLAMIFGMLPLALSPFIPGLGEGAESRAPMAQAVIGGIITSSLLTLVVVPVAYTYLDDFGDWILKRFKKNSIQHHGQ